jgi:hypothetical protein
MTLLDFSEIPPSKAPSARIEAFEDFAKCFFERLYKAKIEKNPARGSDDGADVIANVGGERWLISCKHWSSAINVEEDPRGRLDQHNCQRFVGFYSPGPTAALERKLRSISDNISYFNYEIKNASDIEGELISQEAAEGWKIAFTYFPSSFAKIATSLVRPIRAMTEDNVLLRPWGSVDQAYLPGQVASILHVRGDHDAERKAAQLVASMANETLSDEAFEPIFLRRVANYAKLLPGAFVKLRGASDDRLSASTIFPSWKLSILEDLRMPKHPPTAVYDLCRVWSFWCPLTAKKALMYAHLHRMKHGISASTVNLEADIWWNDTEFTAILENPGEEWRHLVARCSEILTIGEIGRDGNVLTRGYFAALLCFRPAGLARFPSRAQAMCHLAKLFNEETALSRLVDDVAKDLPQADMDYVNRYQHVLAERLVDLHSLPGGLRAIERRGGHLRCVTESAVEDWIPSEDVDSSLIQALGL